MEHERKDELLRNVLVAKAYAAVMALTDEEKERLWERVTEARPALHQNK